MSKGERWPVYKAIDKFGLRRLLQELRDAQTPDEQRVERARKELKSHG